MSDLQDTYQHIALANGVTHWVTIPETTAAKTKTVAEVVEIVFDLARKNGFRGQGGIGYRLPKHLQGLNQAESANGPNMENEPIAAALAAGTVVVRPSEPPADRARDSRRSLLSKSMRFGTVVAAAVLFGVSPSRVGAQQGRDCDCYRECRRTLGRDCGGRCIRSQSFYYYYGDTGRCGTYCFSYLSCMNYPCSKYSYPPLCG